MENKGNVKRKIGILLYSLNGGGAERVATMLSKYFFDEKYDVYVIISQYYANISYDFKGKVRHLPDGGIKNPWINMWYRAQSLKKLKRDLDLDYCISFTEDYNFLNILSRFHEKTIVCIRTYLSGRENESWYNKRYMKTMVPLLYKKADKIVVQCSEQKTDLTNNFKVKSNRFAIIPNYIENQKTEDLVFDDIDKNSPSVVMVGRLMEVKAQWHMIKAMSEVVKSVPKAVLYIYGVGEKKNLLESIAGQYGVNDNVRFMGFVGNVRERIKDADVYVMTSHAEGFPNAILDAFTAGLPVISSDCKSGPRDILTDADSRPTNGIEWAKYGVLIMGLNSKPSDEIDLAEKNLAKAVEKLLTDKELNRHYREKSLERKEYYSKDKITKMWENLLSE